MWWSPAYRPIVGLLALLFLMPTAIALATDIGGQPHVSERMLVLITNPSDIGRMEGQGMDIVEAYDTFVLVDADPETVMAGGWNVLETAYDMYAIDMLGARFDTRDGPQAIRPDLFIDDPGTGHADVKHYIVQFHGPIKTPWVDQVRTLGGHVTYYIPNNAYLVTMDGPTRAIVEDMETVQWVGLYQPVFKVQISLLDTKKHGETQLRVTLHSGSDSAAFMRHLATIDASIDVEKVSPVNDGEIDIQLVTDVAAVPAIAMLDEVYFIEEVPYLQFWNGMAQYIVQSGVTNSKPVFDHGIHGENQTIGNADSGVYVQHWAFHDSAQSVKFADPNTQPNDPPNLNHRKVVHYWTFADSTDSANIMGHGTMTSGTNAGDNTPNGGDGSNNGQAYKAKISFQDIGGAWSLTGVPADLGNLFLPAYNDGARFHSNSWGGGGGGEYSSEAQDIDKFMWTHNDMLVSFSAGNWRFGGTAPAGSTEPPSTAKDCMSVGAAEHSLAGDLKDYSERGPTDDGRLKPTIYTPTDVQSPQINTQNSYTSLGGTSGSNPVAVGNAALVRQYFQEGWYPSGTKNPSDGFNASAALMKAVMVNAGSETQGVGAHNNPYNSMQFPNNDQGHGYVHLDDTLYFQGDNSLLYIVDNKDGLSTGASVELSMNVVSELIPLEVTLVWTDYQGTLGAGTELVNNLDLEVTSPDLTVYKGNVYVTSGTPHQSTSGGSFDSKNVEESFLLKTPTRGGYKIKVTATNVPQGPQPYALILTGDFNRDPDLVLLEKDFSVSHTIPMEGDSISFNGTLRNNGGDVTQPVDVEFRVDDVKQQTLNLNLGTTQTAPFNVTWVATAGNHTFKFVADPGDAIKEGNELNNVVTLFRWCNAMPKANITANVTMALTYEQVGFDASLSTDDGPTRSYFFDFGDTKKQNWGNNPKTSHSYTDEGVYNVTVKVMDNMSLVSLPAEVQVTILNRAPIASARASAEQVSTFMDVIFDSLGSADKDGTFTFLWDFGDGSTSTNATVSHNFTDDGNYTVTLTLTDDDGAQANKSIYVNILNRPPTSSFTAITDVENATEFNSGNTSTMFTFMASASDMDGSIAEYKWDMGDGNTSGESVFDYRFKDDGEYTVTLYVIDDDGDQSTSTGYTVYITNLPPKADLSASEQTVLTYEDISFTQKASDMDGTVEKFLWDMGDGSIYEEPKPTHQYKDDGRYAVSLTVWDDDEEMARAEMYITVKNRAPTAVARYNFTVEQDQPIELDASGSYDKDGTIVFYQWKFNETDIPQGGVVTYAFPIPGQRTFTLEVTDDDGATDLIDLNITVLEKRRPDEMETLGMAMGIPLWLLAVIIVFIISLVIAFVASRRRRSPQQMAQLPGTIDKVASIGQIGGHDNWREGGLDTAAMGPPSGGAGAAGAGPHYGAPEPAYAPAVEYENIYGEVVTDEQRTYEVYDTPEASPRPQEAVGDGEKESSLAPEPVGEQTEELVEAPKPVVVDYESWASGSKEETTNESDIFSGIQTNVPDERQPEGQEGKEDEDIPLVKAKPAKK